MSLYFYSFFLFGQLSQFGTVVKSYQEAHANHDILQEMLAQKAEIINKNGIVLDKIDALSSQKISFSYNEDKRILTDISFEIKK